jgi:hypothetical protein
VGHKCIQTWRIVVAKAEPQPLRACDWRAVPIAGVRNAIAAAVGFAPKTLAKNCRVRASPPASHTPMWVLNTGLTDVTALLLNKPASKPGGSQINGGCSAGS